MPAKKSGKKAHSRGKPKARKVDKGKPKCGDKDICAYLEAWNKYFSGQFLPHYQLIVNAVCNLEKVAIRGLPNNQLLQICPGTGGGAEPPPPPKPPVF